MADLVGLSLAPRTLSHATSIGLANTAIRVAARAAAMAASTFLFRKAYAKSARSSTATVSAMSRPIGKFAPIAGSESVILYYPVPQAVIVPQGRDFLSVQRRDQLTISILATSVGMADQAGESRLTALPTVSFTSCATQRRCWGTVRPCVGRGHGLSSSLIIE